MAYTTRNDDARNEKGQWAPGRSGNPYGRPRKINEPPRTLPEECRTILGNTVTVVENGQASEKTLLAILLTKVIHGAVNRPPKEIVAILVQLSRLGGFNAFDVCQSADEDEREYFTEEHRRTLLVIEEALRAAEEEDKDPDDV